MQAEHEASREYSLNVFNIKASTANQAEVSKYTSPSFFQAMMSKVERRVLPLHSQSYISETGRGFDVRVLRCRGNFYLHGFWQHESYFKSIEKIIREDFTFKTEPDKRNFDRIKAIQNRESAVCIHIRRGDYLLERNRTKLELCTLDYYKRAAAFIGERIKAPNFFVFSDDPVWAQENLVLPYPIFFMDDYNAERAYEDLRLMSACKHFIIANSSFSWWAAWLGQYSQKIVISPRNWFKNGINISSESWIKL